MTTTMTIKAIHTDAATTPFCTRCNHNLNTYEHITVIERDGWAPQYLCQNCGHREHEDELQDTMPPAPLPARNIPAVWPMERGEVVKLIKRFLRERSGKAWSVAGNRGTAYGWIHIRAAGSRQLDDAQRQELGALLGLGRPAFPDGENIAASDAYYRHYLNLAAGIKSDERPEPYWD